MTQKCAERENEEIISLSVVPSRRLFSYHPFGPKSPNRTISTSSHTFPLQVQGLILPMRAENRLET
jgi:hypothetical protein